MKTSSTKEDDWNETERIFQLKQLTEKALLRIKEGRATSFDLHIINTYTCGVTNRDDPTSISIDADLLVKVEEILRLERESLALQYWQALWEWIHVKDNLGGPGLALVQEEVEECLQSQSADELTTLLKQIQQRIHQSDADPDYWESVKRMTQHWRAQKLLQQLQRQLITERERESSTTLVKWQDMVEQKKNATTSDPINTSATQTGRDTHPRALQLYHYYDARTAGARWRRFYGEVINVPSLGAQVEDAVRPLYIAHEISQIVWTRYNQAHYSSTNPPPPIIQGYRFLVFYPAAQETPTYRTEPDPTSRPTTITTTMSPSLSGETQFLRFIALPYQDLVFRIPAQQWELSHKHGFRCTFENDILTLHFRFQRLQYRR